MVNCNSNVWSFILFSYDDWTTSRPRWLARRPQFLSNFFLSRANIAVPWVLYKRTFSSNYRICLFAYRGFLSKMLHFTMGISCNLTGRLHEAEVATPTRRYHSTYLVNSQLQHCCRPVSDRHLWSDRGQKSHLLSWPYQMSEQIIGQLGYISISAPYHR